MLGSRPDAPPLLAAAIAFLRALAIPRGTLVVENAALRQQLAVYQRATKRPTLRPGDRLFWGALRRLWPDWHRPLVVVQPATVLGWHRQGVRALWRWTSRRTGRPRIPRRHIAVIRRISTDHPEWAEDRIAEELAATCGMCRSWSAIRRYMVPPGHPPRGGQTWRAFVRNHAAELRACDFLIEPTAAFTIAYVFVVTTTASTASIRPHGRPSHLAAPRTTSASTPPDSPLVANVTDEGANHVSIGRARPRFRLFGPAAFRVVRVARASIDRDDGCSRTTPRHDRGWVSGSDTRQIPRLIRARDRAAIDTSKAVSRT